MREVLLKAEFFISIYSQTLFEASCLGIPVLYYKKDTQVSHPPFDGKSELVTAFCFDDLVAKMEMFYSNHSIYEPFMDKKVMEKYVGALDGKNTERNLDFIYSLVGQSGGH
jgi:spore coat polysaccharide biosynthesis predicted glycosyltransferase SpsG